MAQFYVCDFFLQLLLLIYAETAELAGASFHHSGRSEFIIIQLGLDIRTNCSHVASPSYQAEASVQ